MLTEPDEVLLHEGRDKRRRVMAAVPESLGDGVCVEHARLKYHVLLRVAVISITFTY